MLFSLLRALGILILLATTACSREDAGVIANHREYLDSQPGPAVSGVSDTLAKTAQDAENAGDFATAAAYYKQLADQYPGKAEYRVKLGDALRRGNQPEQALALYDNVLAASPANAAAREGKGLALMQKGEFDNAEKILMQLRSEGKSSWRTSNALGVLATVRQSPAHGLGYLEEAKRLSPSNPTILNNEGLTLALGRDFTGAVDRLTQASALSAGKPAARRQIDLNTAMVYAAGGRLDSAEAIARQYFEGAALNNNLGFYAHLANDDALAKTYMNMALTQNKTFYERAWNNLEALSGAKSGLSSKSKSKTLSIAPPEEPEASAAPALAPAEPVATAQAAPSPTPAAALAPAAGTPEKPASSSRRNANNGFQSMGRWVGSLLD